MRRKNRLTAAIIAFFGGWFGGHKLYLGQSGQFIFFIFLFFMSINIMRMPLTFLLSLFDAFKLLSMSDEQFDDKYNKGVSANIPRDRLERRRNDQMQQFNRETQDTKSRSQGSKSPFSSSKVAALKSSGIKKYKDFDLDDAIKDFRTAIEIAPQDVALHFNIACAYSLTENKRLAFEHLAKAVGFGLKDVQKIMTHDDLAFIRIQPEFDVFRASGFRNFTVGQSAETPQKNITDEGLLQQLNRLTELKNRGLLSELEFTAEKNKILRQ